MSRASSGAETPLRRLRRSKGGRQVRAVKMPTAPTTSTCALSNRWSSWVLRPSRSSSPLVNVPSRLSRSIIHRDHGVCRTPRLRTVLPKNDAVRCKDRFTVVEDDALGRNTAPQAMQQPVQGDGVERACRQPELLKRISLMCGGLVTVKALGRDFERGGVEIHQRDVRRLCRIAALVEQVAGPDADVEMTGSDVLVVELNKTLRRASPRKMTVESQNNRVVDRRQPTDTALVRHKQGRRARGQSWLGDALPSALGIDVVAVRTVGPRSTSLSDPSWVLGQGGSVRLRPQSV